MFLPDNLRETESEEEREDRVREITRNSSIYHNRYIRWKLLNQRKHFLLKLSTILINCNFFLHRIIRPQKKDNGEHHQIHETLDQDSVRICNKERTCSKEGQDYLE